MPSLNKLPPYLDFADPSHPIQCKVELVVIIAILAFSALAVSTVLGLIEGQVELPARALWQSKALSWLLYICPAALCLWSIKKARAEPPIPNDGLGNLSPRAWLGCIVRFYFSASKTTLSRCTLAITSPRQLNRDITRPST